ncbi:MAG: hypothetical protein ACYDCM_11225 [Candidatus Acidiferrales bacterium]
MLLKGSSPRALGLILLMAAGAGVLGSQWIPSKKLLLECPADETAAIRFFYNSGPDYFHFPLIFRAVSQGDPRLNTAPMGVEGRTAYISRTEMRQLIQKLAHSDASWQESEKVEALGSFKQLRSSDSMEILIVCSKGTTRAKVDPKTICETLKLLDSALKTPRALWEFQLFRQGYGCHVPGFNPDAYPDH